MSRPTADRVLPPLMRRRVVVTDCCWWWTGPVRREYRSDGLVLHRALVAVPATVHRGRRTRARVVVAARLVLEHNGGPLAAGEMGLHHCDQPLCVRLAHLYRGTAADNARDAARRGRSRGVGRTQAVADNPVCRCVEPAELVGYPQRGVDLSPADVCDGTARDLPVRPPALLVTPPYDDGTVSAGIGLVPVGQRAVGDNR